MEEIFTVLVVLSPLHPSCDSYWFIYFFLVTLSLIYLGLVVEDHRAKKGEITPLADLSSSTFIVLY